MRYNLRVHIARFMYREELISGEVVDGRLVLTPNGSKLSLEEVELLPPCVPSKLVCVGRNYAEHAAELGNAVPDEPLLFLKPPTAVVATGAEIEYPHYSKLLNYEGELAVVIGTRCRNIQTVDARDAIAGYTVMNDVTARDVQRADKQWTRGKAFDTSAPLGPWLATELGAHDVSVRTWVNGELRQDGTTRDLVFRIEHLVAYVSRVMTLEVGDVIATGTPSGVGELRVGDEVEVEISGIGRLTNTVVAAPTQAIVG
jgi:2-keto-4-pentenoate hydratase/2-oxohepta-3-ene-1,7-dioic acid hydratase in catechol pathway